MTPWYAWALFILGPFICAGAGAWVMRLFDRQAMADAAESMYQAGRIDGRQEAQAAIGSMFPAGPTRLLRGGHFTCPGGHEAYCPGCQADSDTQRLRAKFAAVRYRLGPGPASWPGFGEEAPARPLAIAEAHAVIP